MDQEALAVVHTDCRDEFEDYISNSMSDAERMALVCESVCFRPILDVIAISSQDATDIELTLAYYDNGLSYALCIQILQQLHKHLQYKYFTATYCYKFPSGSLGQALHAVLRWVLHRVDQAQLQFGPPSNCHMPLNVVALIEDGVAPRGKGAGRVCLLQVRLRHHNLQGNST